MTDIHIATIPKNVREEMRVSLSEFGGYQLFNARVFFEAHDGTMRPGKGGIAFRIEQLPEFAHAVIIALNEAKARGLVE